MISIDKLCYASRLRYENASVKFAYSLLTLLFCIVSKDPCMAVLVLSVNGVLTVWGGGVNIRRYMNYLLLPLVFLIMSTLAIVINFSPTPLDLFSIGFGSGYLTGSRAALLYAAQLILTALASVSCLYFLAMTTPMPDILTVMGSLRCPKLMLELMLLIYRFIFVLSDTAHAILTAQSCRLGNRDYRTSVHAFSQMGSVLMIRAVKRSNALYSAMEARCYDGSIRVLSETHPAKLSHICAVVFFECLLAVLTIWRYLHEPF